MKKLVLISLLCIASAAQAQDTTWTASKAKIWGSKAEKQQQDAIGRQSANSFLCRFVGFKSFYDQNISEFLQAHGYGLDDAINSTGANTYVLSKNGLYIGNKPAKIKITFYHNADDRLTSGTIKAPFTTLALLFLTYWPHDAVYYSEAQLKPGTAAVKHSYGDLVSFKWVNGQPVITITKDPNVSMPIAQSSK